MLCERPLKMVEYCTPTFDLKSLARKPLASIATIPKVTAIRINQFATVIGFQLSDGKYIQGCEGVANITKSLPDSLSLIEVRYIQTHRTFASIKFVGATTVEVGDASLYASQRVEVCRFGPEEQLLGCILHHGRKSTHGITWVKWSRPSI